MPKRVERKGVRNLERLNEWLGKEGKNYRVISIQEIQGMSSIIVFVETDISNEEWYNNHLDAVDAASVRRAHRKTRNS